MKRAFGVLALREDASGAVSLIFTLCIFILCGMIGGAVDMALYARAKVAHTEAIDSAALAGARVKQTGGTNEQALERAQAMYELATSNIPVDGPASFQVSADGNAVIGIADLSIPAVFLRVIGIEKLQFQVRNRAEFQTPTIVEMALMLDTTGSMSGQKIDDLKTAVEQLIEIVIRSEGTDQSRIALAPFSNAVRLTTKQFRAATGATKGGGGCVVERIAEIYDDTQPDGNYLAPFDDSKGECKSAREVFPLTNKKSDLKKMVKSLSADGSTAGHLGTAWAWYLLSPKWNELFDDSEQPKPYTMLDEVTPSGARKLRKIAVLMTDGEYNTSYNGIDATEQARAICAEMNKSGLEVYTIGFDVTAPSVVETLTGCASNPTQYYPAKDGSDLITAFIDIAKKASTVRLAQ